MLKQSDKAVEPVMKIYLYKYIFIYKYIFVQNQETGLNV